MNALVLFTHTGSGHVTAAEALYDEFQRLNINVKKVDTLKILRKDIAKNISKLYNNIVIKTPSLFGKIYNAGKLISNPHTKSIVYAFNILSCKKLYTIIEENKPDIIICTHIFPAQSITHIKKKYKLKVITAGVSTDYTCAPFWEETELDYLFIPHKDLIEEFKSKGLSENQLIPMGMPVRIIFKSKIPTSCAKKLLNYNSEKKHIIIIGGSMGAGDIYNLSKSFIEHFINEEITIICGTNSKLYNSLLELNLHSNIKILGFIDYISELMDSADVLISKAGGLTSSEAMTKNIPIIFINSIPGVETANCNFFIKHNTALHAHTINESISLCSDLLNNNCLKSSLIEGQKRLMNKNSTNDIVNFLLNKVKR